MKHFTLVKHHPCTQLAHLYEHLFIATVAAISFTTTGNISCWIMR